MDFISTMVESMISETQIRFWYISVHLIRLSVTPQVRRHVTILSMYSFENDSQGVLK